MKKEFVVSDVPGIFSKVVEQYWAKPFRERHWKEKEEERQVHVKKWKEEHNPPCSCYRVGQTFVLENAFSEISVIIRSFSCHKCGRTVNFYPLDLDSLPSRIQGHLLCLRLFRRRGPNGVRGRSGFSRTYST